MPSFRLVLIPLLITALVGCVTVPRVEVPQPLRPVAADSGESSTVSQGAAPGTLREVPTPTPPQVATTSAPSAGRSSEPNLSGPPISASLEGLPLPSFINEAFGNLLKVNFQIDPSLSTRADLVTLRLPSAQTPNEFYRLTSQVLRAYGVAVTWDNGIARITPAEQADANEPPLIISGRALPDVPTSHRPVFQLVELRFVRTNDVANMLKIAFSKQTDLRIEEDLNRNAVILYGKPDSVRQAVAAINVFDRPHLRGKHSTRLEPAFVGAPELAQRLIEVLSLQGYSIGSSLGTGAGTIVLPVASANMVLVFAPDPVMLQQVVEWAKTIDRPNPLSSGDSLYYYQVKNTNAADLVNTLRSISTPLATAAPAAGATAAPAAGAPAPAAQAAGPVMLGNSRMTVDAPRNAIVFQGPAADWQRMMGLIEKMDRAARQVMVEVTIAEVSLDDGQNFGASWFARSGLGRFGGRLNFGTLPATGAAPSGSGLTYLLDVAGENRIALNAFANDNRVSILSTPRLLVKSGEQASIDVGTEVPTISSQTSATQQTEGNSNLLQTIQYRKTGVLLTVTPTIYSDDRIDLEISQEVSEALPLAENSGISSPSILNRKIETSLTLRDGGSVLLGGLMSQGETDSDSGIPYLKDVPILGHLFKTQERSRNRTELVLIIRPYIIESDEEAENITEAISNQLEMIDIPPPLHTGTGAAPGPTPAQTQPLPDN